MSQQYNAIRNARGCNANMRMLAYACIYVSMCPFVYLSTYLPTVNVQRCIYIYIHVGQIEVIPQHMFTAVLLVATGRFTGGNDMHHTCVSLKLKL